MKAARNGWQVAAGLAVAGLAYALTGLGAVPFHPDESTYLFMSQDFATVFLEARPQDLLWRPGQPVTPEVRYRLLDAPLGRYLIGLGWRLAGYTRADLNADWAWEQSWEDNAAAGRQPAPGLLLAARAPAALLGGLAVILAAGLAWSARGAGAGLLAGGLLLFHPLLQLHTRRAMSEGPLAFTSALAVAGGLALARLIESGASARYTLGAALGAGVLAGLAVASKHSAAALAPALLAPALLALGQRPEPRRQRAGRALGLCGAAALAAGLVVFALSPVLWAAPLDAVAAMAAARVQLSGAQSAQLQLSAAEQLLPTAAARLSAVVAELFLRPPAVWDLPLANQLDHLEPQAQAYFAQPLFHRLPPAAGAGLLALTVAGLVFSALRLIRDRLGPATRVEQAVWAWGLSTLIFTLAAVPIDWQRYFLPLLPPAMLFAALGGEALAAPFIRRFAPPKGK